MTDAAESRTVPPKVNFRERHLTDRPFAVAYALSYIAFLSCGFYIVSQANDRYTVGENGVKGINEYFAEDARRCCGDAGFEKGLLCEYLNPSGRRLQTGNSKFDGDEGIFDAFLEAPEIIVGVLACGFAIATLWVGLLRYFAKPIVILVELLKVVAFITLGVVAGNIGAMVTCFVVAALLIAYSYWVRKEIMFAAKIITHSTIAMKENPSILAGAFIVKLLFAGNAGLFVLYFSKAFNVVEVKEESMTSSFFYNDPAETQTMYCVFASPGYMTGMWWYLSLSYLWTVFFLNHMRLSIISTIVGAWHFHPEDKPSFAVVIKNTLQSCGTIAISSLVSTIAEKIKRMFLERSIITWFNPLTYTLFAPFHIIACIVGASLGTFVSMFTKFALILHVFTGRGFKGSAKHVFNILSRHFKGGVVTEMTSRSVLTIASYAFSLALAAITLVWIDGRFDCGVTTDLDKIWWILYILMVVFSVWYAVLGLYVMILVNSFLQNWGRETVESNGEPFNHWWIPFLAACFVGCIAMMFFTMLSGIFLDTIDTLFLCFAIDKDNNVDMTNSELASLVKELPGYTEVEVVSDFGDAETGETIALAVAVPVPETATDKDTFGLENSSKAAGDVAAA